MIQETKWYAKSFRPRTNSPKHFDTYKVIFSMSFSTSVGLEPITIISCFCSSNTYTCWMPKFLVNNAKSVKLWGKWNANLIALSEGCLRRRWLSKICRRPLPCDPWLWHRSRKFFPRLWESSKRRALVPWSDRLRSVWPPHPRALGSDSGSRR